MKNLLLKFFVVVFMFASSYAYSSSIDYRGNQSAEYVRTLSRNAALDASDIVNYNPAGTAFMKDGFHINFSLQHFFKTYTMDYDGEEYKSTEPSHFVPNLYAIYKMEKIAAFAAITIPAGGGEVKFDDGIALMPMVESAVASAAGSPITSANYQSGNLTAGSIYYGGTLGAAYAINDMVSVALAARYIYAVWTYEGEATYELLAGVTPAANTTLELDSEQTASGFGGIIGVDIKPIKNLNIGLRYETKTKLEFEADTSKNDFSLFLPQLVDGEKQRRDLPALFAMGVGYNINEQLYLSLSFTYYFIKQADAGSDDAYSDDYDNGYDTGLGVQYKVTPELELSLGFMYSSVGSNADTVSDLDMSLDARKYGAGAKYLLQENLSFTFAYFYSDFISQENSSKTVDYNKDIHVIAYGVEYSF